MQRAAQLTPARPAHALAAAAELAVLAGGLILLTFAVFNVPATDAGHAPLTAPPDAALLAQFPSLRVTESGQYRVLSDASDAEVRHVVQLLDELHAQFRQQFAALLDPGQCPGNIRVVFFSHADDYRAYAQRVAPALAGSDGCYDSTENRLAILNQAGNPAFARARQQIEVRQQRLARWTTPDATQRLQASARLSEWRDTVASEARASTDRLIRHEGAHQLFHAYGIESKFPVEPTWLTEGLAQYCETAPLGASHPPLVNNLVRARDAGTLIPLATLLNHRDPAGFFALGNGHTELAYAESWALTYFLMQPDRCYGFENFIRHYRDLRLPSAAVAEQQRDPAAVLAEHLGTSLPALESQWQKFISDL